MRLKEVKEEGEAKEEKRKDRGRERRSERIRKTTIEYEPLWGMRAEERNYSIAVYTTDYIHSMDVDIVCSLYDYKCREWIRMTCMLQSNGSYEAREIVSRNHALPPIGQITLNQMHDKVE